jgi:hypothetical protein
LSVVGGLLHAGNGVSVNSFAAKWVARNAYELTLHGAGLTEEAVERVVEGGLRGRLQARFEAGGARLVLVTPDVPVKLIAFLEAKRIKRV